eukprot:79726-Pleurochrysis_carterae.AAC.1
MGVDPQAFTLQLCQSTSDTLLRRFLGTVVSPSATLLVREIESVEFWGDVYEASCSWVVHKCHDHPDLATPCLAKVERIMEVAAGPRAPRIIYM